MMARKTALAAVETERRRQVRRGYTARHDNEHAINDFLVFIESRIRGIREAAQYPEVKKALVEIGALSVAAIEMVERKEREP